MREPTPKKFRLRGTRRARGAIGAMQSFETYVIAAEAEDAMSAARHNWANSWQDVLFTSVVEVD